jgi:hypothetical protein
MKPSQVAISLRHIAAKIQASKSPDRRLVARDLKKIISKIAGMDMDDAPFKGAELNGIKCLKSVIREHKPLTSDSPYPVIDGVFQFSTPNGHIIVFDGRFDQNDAKFVLLKDGKDISNQIEPDMYDMFPADEALEGVGLEEILEHCLNS